MLPDDLRTALLNALGEIRANYVEGRFEPSELNGGKLCEVVYRVLQWYTDRSRTYQPLGTSIRNFGQAVKQFEGLIDFPDSIRFHIPQALTFLYTLRNKRGVGHVGGEVNPNHMDAEVIFSVSNWIVAELVRILHRTTTDEAQAVVDWLVERQLPLVWESGETKRVLDPSMSYKDRALVLLYSVHPMEVDEKELRAWCEHPNASNFRRDVLKKAHAARLIEYDPVSKVACITPLGVRYVENLLKAKWFG